MQFKAFEKVMHFLPSLKTLHVSLIGLELPDDEATKRYAKRPRIRNCCEECNQEGQKKNS